MLWRSINHIKSLKFWDKKCWKKWNEQKSHMRPHFLFIFMECNQNHFLPKDLLSLFCASGVETFMQICFMFRKIWNYVGFILMKFFDYICFKYDLIQWFHAKNWMIGWILLFEFFIQYFFAIFPISQFLRFSELYGNYEQNVIIWHHWIILAEYPQ